MCLRGKAFHSSGGFVRAGAMGKSSCAALSGFYFWKLRKAPNSICSFQFRVQRAQSLGMQTPDAPETETLLESSLYEWEGVECLD